jgi:predicted O-methyltransferase YrrM
MRTTEPEQSRQIWGRVLAATARVDGGERAAFFRTIEALEALRLQASVQTGSIPLSSAWLLFSLAAWRAPGRIVEIGTYIGKSTLALALGADRSGRATQIDTCDQKNDIRLPALSRTPVRQHPRATSTAMLRKLADELPPGSIELLHVDGQVTETDLPFLQSLLSADAVVALDDFAEGAKGMDNSRRIAAAGLLPHHLLVGPCPPDLLAYTPDAADTSTALLLPPAACAPSAAVTSSGNNIRA